MRKLLFFCVSAALLGCTGPKNLKSKPMNVNGTWIPVQQEIGGSALPAAAFEKQRLELKDHSYTMTAESVDKGEVEYSDGKMDIYGKEGVNKGKHFTALYKLENEKLFICYNLTGGSYPESYVTSGKPAFFLSVFRKE